MLPGQRRSAVATLTSAPALASCATNDVRKPSGSFVVTAVSIADTLPIGGSAFRAYGRVSTRISNVRLVVLTGARHVEGGVAPSVRTCSQVQS